MGRTVEKPIRRVEICKSRFFFLYMCPPFFNVYFLWKHLFLSNCLRPSRHRALTSDLLMDVLQFCCDFSVDVLNDFCVCLTD